MRVELSLLISGVTLRINTDIDAQAWYEGFVAQACVRKGRALLRAGLKPFELNAALAVFIPNITIDDLRAVQIEDEVESEALALAEAEIVAQLARDGLPPPRSLRDHAQALVNINASFRARAQQRIIARAAVANETLSAEL